ncbi:MAG TPA: hypothetical protein VFE88_04255 [Candidatus Nanoarchaeia archaeon]|nr:hypothetical protein [Candidatus Nanoarchaeia archaeon]
MNKRGQVTIFIILGVLILILAALILYLRDSRGLLISPQEYLTSQLQTIQTDIEACATKALSQGLPLFGKQGGSFSPVNYKLHQGSRVPYYCQNIPGDERCLNSIPPLSSLQQELQTYLTFEITNCADKDLLKDLPGVTVSGTKHLEVKTTLQQGILLVQTGYDVKLSKDQATLTFTPIKQSYDAPLEELYYISRDIVQAHATTGFFDQLIYMLNKKGAYEINVDKPFPDIVYKINKKNSNYEFWFSIEGESS